MTHKRHPDSLLDATAGLSVDEAVKVMHEWEYQQSPEGLADYAKEQGLLNKSTIKMNTEKTGIAKLIGFFYSPTQKTESKN